MSILSEHELSQPVVVKIIQFLDKRLDTHRKNNDHPNADPLLRGQIKEVKFLQTTLSLELEPKKWLNKQQI